MIKKAAALPPSKSLRRASPRPTAKPVESVAQKQPTYVVRLNLANLCLVPIIDDLPPLVTVQFSSLMRSDLIKNGLSERAIEELENVCAEHRQLSAVWGGHAPPTSPRIDEQIKALDAAKQLAKALRDVLWHLPDPVKMFLWSKDMQDFVKSLEGFEGKAMHADRMIALCRDTWHGQNEPASSGPKNSTAVRLAGRVAAVVTHFGVRVEASGSFLDICSAIWGHLEIGVEPTHAVRKLLELRKLGDGHFHVDGIYRGYK